MPLLLLPESNLMTPGLDSVIAAEVILYLSGKKCNSPQPAEIRFERRIRSFLFRLHKLTVYGLAPCAGLYFSPSATAIATPTTFPSLPNKVSANTDCISPLYRLSLTPRIFEPDPQPSVEPLQYSSLLEDFLIGSAGKWPCAMDINTDKDIICMDKPETLEMLNGRGIQVERLSRALMRGIARDAAGFFISRTTPAA